MAVSVCGLEVFALYFCGSVVFRSTSNLCSTTKSTLQEKRRLFSSDGKDEKLLFNVQIVSIHKYIFRRDFT